MTAQLKSLWPQLPKIIHTPTAILQMQADGLSAATGGTLRGIVAVGKEKDEHITAELTVEAPLLSEKYELFAIEHKTKRPYPVWFIGDGDEQFLTETAFFKALGDRLNSAEIMSLLSSLIARSSESGIKPQKA